ncbi:DUF371 domain-containing protein [Halococcoides cellulosivorans]|uniref:DUF371 domain-containing protein n=1 Tax=Halococcoides cellulosivorans TaxID=1679096 RepID=A0A2R4WYP4_9EURY|nr:DUF371 domain-containing protein [Halococcoides cellulosivorans]AWB26663.1 DUF371 domain-containing protein [Halococcoides cellulosivorans]
MVELQAHGHEHVSAAHESTFEVTSDDFLTPAGDCIVGIESDAVPSEFPPDFVAACQSADATITIELQADGHTDRVTARGDPDLTFENDRSLVVRTSDYVDDRTVAVEADAAAADLDRDLIDALADGADLDVEFAVED